MIAALFFALILVIRFFSFRVFVFVSLVAFLTFPEYIYVLGVLSLQKLISVLFIVDSIRLARLDFSKVSKVSAGLLAFFLLLIVSSFLSNAYPGVEMRAISITVQYASLYFFVSATVRSNALSFQNALSIVLVAFIINVPFVILEQYRSQTLGEIIAPYSNFENTEWAFVAREKIRMESVRSQGLLVSPLALGILSVFSVVIAYVKSVSLKQFKRYFGINLLYVYIGLAFLVIAATGSRSGMLALLVVLISFMFISRFSLYYFFVLSCLLLLSIIIYPLGYLDGMFVLLDPIFGRGDYSDLANSNSVRLMQLNESIDAFLISPVWGHGADSAIHFMTYYTIDSFWLSLFVNFGVLGAILFLYLYSLILIRFNNSGKELFFPFSMMFFVFAIVISLNYLFMIFCFVLAILNSKKFTGKMRGSQM
jgi:hypothetical protein